MISYYLKSIKYSIDDLYFNSYPPNISLTYDCNMDCKYCYTNGLEKDFKNNISMENFKKILRWLKKQNINQVLLTGGEPTIHPKIEDIINYCSKENVKMGFYSNGLIPSSALEKLNQKNTVSLNLHFNYEKGTKRYNQFLNTLETLNRKNIRFFLRFNFDNPKIDLNEVIKLSKKFNAPLILGFLNPGYKYEKKLLFSEVKTIGKEITEFMKKLRKNKIITIFARPLPICFFNKTDVKMLRLFHAFHSTCSPGNKGLYTTRIVINPDLSFFPCYAIFKKTASITDYKNLNEINTAFKEEFLNMRSKTLFEECKTCKEYTNKNCQGGCLAFKTQ